MSLDVSAGVRVTSCEGVKAVNEHRAGGWSIRRSTEEQ